MKMIDLSTFVFYFEDPAKLELVLNKVPWSFNNIILAIQKLLLGMFSSGLTFNSTSIGFSSMISCWIRGLSPLSGELLRKLIQSLRFTKFQ